MLQTYIYGYIKGHKYTNIQSIYTHAYTHTYTATYIHSYIHTQLHTYTATYIHRYASNWCALQEALYKCIDIIQ